MRKIHRFIRPLVALSLLLISCSGLLAPRATSTPAGPTPTPIMAVPIPRRMRNRASTRSG
ncbi:MAG: hypothetical protein ACM3PY_04130 [Omnitrophica WOR_2 bacterium]